MSAVGALPVVMVDCARAGRGKADTAFRRADVTSFQRVKIDIRHLYLPRVRLVAATPTATAVYASKHLCGVATDLALRCAASASEGEGGEGGKGGEGESGEGGVGCDGVAIALCCHHKCTWADYVGRAWMEKEMVCVCVCVCACANHSNSPPRLAPPALLSRPV